MTPLQHIEAAVASTRAAIRARDLKGVDEADGELFRAVRCLLVARALLIEEAESNPQPEVKP